MKTDERRSSLLRRPLVLLLMLVVAGGGAFAGWAGATDTFQSRAVVLVVPSGTGTAEAREAVPDNPLTRLDDGVSQLALVVSSQLRSEAVGDRVRAAGGDGSYSASAFSEDDGATAQLGPLVTITATSATARGAERAAAVLVDQSSSQLAAVQSAANVPTAVRAQAIVSTPASTGTVVGQPRLRAAGVLGVAGGLAVLVLAAAAGSLGIARRGAASSAAVRERAGSGAAHDRIDVPDQSTDRPADRSTEVAREARPVAKQDPDGPGRFGPPSAQPVAEAVLPGTRRRQEVLREMVREEWQRSGSNVPWTRVEHRAAYERAEERLALTERRRRHFEVDSRFDDVLDHRVHG